MPHIFISYAKVDTQPLAFELCDLFNDMPSVTAWVDRSLLAGRSWEGDIQREIRNCDVFVVLYSPDINRHLYDVTATESYVLEEIAYARYTLKKPIIPVMAQPTEPPMGMTRIQYIPYASKGLTVMQLANAILGEAGISTTSTPVSPKNSAEAVRQIIGDPFDWCKVPEGDFLYGKANQTLSLPAYSMAKYPITYSQFQTFVEADDGIHDERWWFGFAEISNQFVFDPRWKIDDHPRESVSWYDVIAFCRWLSHRLGGGYDLQRIDEWLVRLPTEFEWEKAARGTQGLLYPYGNEFDSTKCNTRESGIERTTPVTQYPQGASPYGVLDMAGNVWEWCLTEYTDPQREARQERLYYKSDWVVRGGGWYDVSSIIRATYRGHFSANFRLNDVGFRIVAPSL